MWINVWIAVAVVAAVGAIFGVILSLASHFFAVKRDEKLSAIRRVLPGANCGACGYAGCDGYAEALAKGEAKPNLCLPGAGEVSVRLSSLLGVKAEVTVLRAATVLCNGTCEATRKRADYRGEPTCRSASLVWGGGPGSCTYSCIGFGDCAAACPTHAISVKDGVARVDRSVCIGCGVCVRTCPKSIIDMIPRSILAVNLCSNHDAGAKTRAVCKNGCIACRKCEKVCPTSAIAVHDNLARIDEGKCISCGKCVEVCPVHCLYAVGKGDVR